MNIWEEHALEVALFVNKKYEDGAVHSGDLVKGSPALAQPTVSTKPTAPASPSQSSSVDFYSQRPTVKEGIAEFKDDQQMCAAQQP